MLDSAHVISKHSAGWKPLVPQLGDSGGATDPRRHYEGTKFNVPFIGSKDGRRFSRPKSLCRHTVSHLGIPAGPAILLVENEPLRYYVSFSPESSVHLAVAISLSNGISSAHDRLEPELKRFLVDQSRQGTRR